MGQKPWKPRGGALVHEHVSCSDHAGDRGGNLKLSQQDQTMHLSVYLSFFSAWLSASQKWPAVVRHPVLSVCVCSTLQVSLQKRQRSPSLTTPGLPDSNATEMMWEELRTRPLRELGGLSSSTNQMGTINWSERERLFKSCSDWSGVWRTHRTEEETQDHWA